MNTFGNGLSDLKGIISNHLEWHSTIKPETLAQEINDYLIRLNARKPDDDYTIETIRRMVFGEQHHPDDKAYGARVVETVISAIDIIRSRDV